MCGIAGWVNLRQDSSVDFDGDKSVLRSMCDRIRHRGPDSEGMFHEDGVALGIRRLAVIDLVTGEQPFFDESRSVIAVMNGEIYNFRELRKDLEKRGHRFVSHTDTEVLPHLYEEYGVKLVEKLNGMFAFAIWDSRNKRLFAARDRFGEKPIHYGIFNRKLIFGSEIKALFVHPDVHTSLNLEALQQYLTFDCVPAPLSIFKGIFKLPAGHALTVEGGKIRIDSYWNPNHRKSVPAPSIDEAAEELKSLLDDSIRMRMVSDVPVGILLSGGVDSSTIAALARLHSSRPLKSFCIGFDERRYDESAAARQVASHLGTEHVEERLTAGRAAQLLPEIAIWMDEPLADPSVLPTFLLSQLARSEVTVALGGDGADELFGGYPSYYAHKLMERYVKFPHFIRKNLLENLIKRLPAGRHENSINFMARRFIRAFEIPDPVARHFSFFGSFTGSEQERLLTPFVLSQNGHDLYAEARCWSKLCQFESQRPSDNIVEQMQFLDLKLYLAEDILAKVDRASMAVSLEVRSPFLDPRIGEFAAGLPRNYKLKCDTAKFALGNTGKYILKKVARPMLPAFVTRQTKRGFVIPTGVWINGPLKPLVSELLSTQRIKDQGLFDPIHVQRLLSEHQAGTANHAKKLWSLMMFESWRENWTVRPNSANLCLRDKINIAA